MNVYAELLNDLGLPLDADALPTAVEEISIEIIPLVSLKHTSTLSLDERDRFIDLRALKTCIETVRKGPLDDEARRRLGHQPIKVGRTFLEERDLAMARRLLMCGLYLRLTAAQQGQGRSDLLLELSVALDEAGRLEEACGQHALAAQHHAQFLELLRGMVTGASGEALEHLKRGLGFSLGHIAWDRYREGDLEKSRALSEESLGHHRDAFAAAPDQNRRQCFVAALLQHARICGALPEASWALDQVEAVLRKALASKAAPEDRLALVNCLINRTTRTPESEPVDVLPWLTEALALLEPLRALAPKHAGLTLTHSVILARMGLALGPTEPARALQCHELSISLADAVSAAQPQDVIARRQAAFARGRRSQTWLAIGEVARAADDAAAHVAGLEALARQEPDRLDLRADLVMAQLHLARTQPDPKPLWAAALSQSEALLAERPTNPEFAKLLNKVKSQTV
jgi:hypothetical protein